MNYTEREQKNKLFNNLLRQAAKKDVTSYAQHYALLCQMMHSCEDKMLKINAKLVLDEDIKQLITEIKSKVETEGSENLCFRNYLVAGSKNSKENRDSILADFTKTCFTKLSSANLHNIDIQIYDNLVRIEAIMDDLILDFSCHGMPNTYLCTGEVYRDTLNCCIQAIGYIKNKDILSCLTSYYQTNNFAAIKLQRESEIVWDGNDNVLKGTVEKNDITFTLRLCYNTKRHKHFDQNVTNIVAIEEYDFDKLDGYHFELFCAELLKKNGFDNVSVTRGSGDQGIDIIAYRDEVKYGFQCKCYSSSIGNHAVQEVFAGTSFYQCHVGIVLTNSYFTNSAIELAKHNRIILWDRDKLLQLIKGV